MRSLFSFLYIVSVYAFPSLRVEEEVNPSIYLERFENWILQFTIEIRDKHHFYDVLKKWMINDEYIDHVNNNHLSYTLGHNQFSGMDEFDFIQYVIKNPIIQSQSMRTVESNVTVSSTLPSSVDWREHNAVTPVKDQGQCGSCWSFSTTGALEGVYSIESGKLVSFSEQQLVDCDNLKNGGRDHGCNGGLMDNAFSWISKNGGLCSEEDYPYMSQDGDTFSCQKECHNVVNSKIMSWVDVQPTDKALMTAIAQQPVSIAIEADQRDFQLYKSGVFTGKCGTTLDHGVLVVGYGSQENLDYYLVKNSWGTTWGDEGYIRLGRGAQYNGGQGQCGILLEASYPLL
jgi:C1A family cysteine protease